MANFAFNVNTSGIIHLTDRLERLNKSAFPSAVRATLSDAAFEMKQKNILESAKKNMKVKQPNFFKANTGVERARFSRNVESMKATSGFINKKGVKASKAVNYGMEANEVGATDSSGLMYKKATRTGRGLVRRKNYYDKDKLASKYKSAKFKRGGKSNMVRLVAGLMENKPVKIISKKGTFIVRVISISSGVDKKKPDIQLEFLMSDRNGDRTAKTKATHFNREAAQKTQKQIEGFYIKNADFQFKRVWR